MFSLQEVVPWGRSFDEYRRMFVLGDADLRRRILGCADGPASFNAGATRHGARVVSCDPLYRCSAADIRDRIAATYDIVLEQTRQNASTFVWDSIPSVEALGAMRMEAMTDFLNDYEVGKTEGRYVDASLPTLPFADRAFDLALSSHFLFLYTSQLGAPFHLAAIREMSRVAFETRIFPLLTLDGSPSPYVEQIAADFGATGYTVSIERVPYEFQRGGHEMMRIMPRESPRS